MPTISMPVGSLKPRECLTEGTLKGIKNSEASIRKLWGLTAFEAIPVHCRPSSARVLSTRFIRTLATYARRQPVYDDARKALLSARSVRMEEKGLDPDEAHELSYLDIETVIRQHDREAGDESSDDEPLMKAKISRRLQTGHDDIVPGGESLVSPRTARKLKQLEGNKPSVVSSSSVSRRGERSETTQKRIDADNNALMKLWGFDALDAIPYAYRPQADKISSRLIQRLAFYARRQPDVNLARQALLAARRQRLLAAVEDPNGQSEVKVQDVETVIKWHDGGAEASDSELGEESHSHPIRSAAKSRSPRTTDITQRSGWSVATQKRVEASDALIRKTWGVSAWEAVPVSCRAASAKDMSSRLTKDLARYAKKQPVLETARRELLLTRERRLVASGEDSDEAWELKYCDVEEAVKKYDEEPKRAAREERDMRLELSALSSVASSPALTWPHDIQYEQQKSRSSTKTKTPHNSVSPKRASKKRQRTIADSSGDEVTPIRKSATPFSKKRLISFEESSDEAPISSSKRHGSTATTRPFRQSFYSSRSQSRHTPSRPVTPAMGPQQITQRDLINITSLNAFSWPVSVEHPSEKNTWYEVSSAAKLLSLIEDALERRREQLAAQVPKHERVASLADSSVAYVDDHVDTGLPTPSVSEDSFPGAAGPYVIVKMFDDFQYAAERKAFFVKAAMTEHHRGMIKAQNESLETALTRFEEDTKAARRTFEKTCCDNGLMWISQGDVEQREGGDASFTQRKEKVARVRLNSPLGDERGRSEGES